MNSSDLRPCDYDLYPFNHIQNLLNDLDSTMRQDEAIQAILLKELLQLMSNTIKINFLKR
jgi:hypothetical protein